MAIDDEIDFGRRFVLRSGLIAVAGLAATSMLEAEANGIETIRLAWKNGNRAFVTKAQNGKYRADIVSSKEITGNDYSTTQEILQKTGAYVCFNGSFFENDGSPSGLYIRKGETKHQITQGKGDGVLYADPNGQIHIIAVDDFEGFKNQIIDAVQVNLLRHNDVVMYVANVGAQISPRNLIGMTNNGMVDAIFKDTNFTLGDRYMKQSHNCHTVAALDGYTSASASDRVGGSSYMKSDRLEERKVPNFIVLYQG